jgi:hypothetical protein
VPPQTSLFDKIKLTTKEKLTEETRVIHGSIDVAVPMGWGVHGGGQGSSVYMDAIELFPEGTRIPEMWSFFSVIKLPINKMSIYRSKVSRYRTLSESLQYYQSTGANKVPGRKTVDLGLQKIGGLEWLVYIYDGDIIEGKPVQTWRGFTNVEKTPYCVVITYQYTEKDRLARQMIKLIPKISFKVPF